MLEKYYRYLKEKRDVQTLAQCALFDERVYKVIGEMEDGGGNQSEGSSSRRPPVVDHEFLNEFARSIPNDPLVARAFGRAICYSTFNDTMHNKNIIPLASALQKSEDTVTATVLSEVMGNLGVPERQRLELFNYSETYRHMIISRHPFAQRGCMRCLSWIFTDDFLTEAINLFQYKTDILNHINRTYVRTWDFPTWRYSVRVMALAGQYNEDRQDLVKTERFSTFVTKVLPTFLCYFVFGAFYGTYRHFPMRMRGEGLIPYWLARQRGIWTGFVTGLIGSYYQWYPDWKVAKMRAIHEEGYQREMRRRKAAADRKLPFRNNTYYDSLDGITNRIWTKQLTYYTVLGSSLLLTVFPLPRINFPKWMGDVQWRFPLLPRLIPVSVGLPASSKCLIPYVVAPFTIVSFGLSNLHGATAYDFYVMARYRWWKGNRAATEMGG